MNISFFFIRFFPFVFLFLGPITLSLTYGVAVSKGHVSPLFPYISDTGTKPPESCIFTFCLSASSFFLFAITYVRYREISEIMKLKPSIKIKIVWNKIAFIIGIGTCLGLSIVYSFQETNAMTMHFGGALLTFFCGAIYFIFQTLFSIRAFPKEKAIFYIRLLLTTLKIICLIGTFAPIHAALSEFKGEDRLHWTEKDGGYTYHLISAFSEWIMITCFMFYLSTFYWDFSKFEMHHPVLKFNDSILAEDRTEERKNPTV